MKASLLQDSEVKPEIDVIWVIIQVWSKRFWIGGFTLVMSAIGVVVAITSPPLYHSEAILAPKSNDGASGVPSMLSSIGGLGSIVAGQLNLGDTKLEKLEIILLSRGLAETVILAHDLLPAIFPAQWKAIQNKAQPASSMPSLREGVEAIRSGIVKVSVDAQKNIITIGVDWYDSTLACNLAQFYVEALNEKIRNDVRVEADSNRQYLERQLFRTVDPLVREKIMQLMSMEIEKSMLVSSNSFDVLEKPAVPLDRFKPNKRLIVTLYFIVSLAVAVFLTIAWASMGKLVIKRQAGSGT